MERALHEVVNGYATLILGTSAKCVPHYFAVSSSLAPKASVWLRPGPRSRGMHSMARVAIGPDTSVWKAKKCYLQSQVSGVEGVLLL